MAASIWPIAEPVVPMGKNRVGSESRQEARSRQSVVIVVVSNFPRFCDVFHKATRANQPEGLGNSGGNVLSGTAIVNEFLNIVSKSMKTLIVGHRGWPTRFPDNTLSGYYAAATVADAVELDIRRSADGKLVVSHDPTLGGLEVASHDWATLGEFDLGDGHRPVLLDEAIAALPGTPIQFEIKNLPHQPGFEPDHRVALEAAARTRPGDIVTSFYWPTLVAVRREFPDVATGALLDKSGNLPQAVAHCLDVGHVSVVPEQSMLNEDAMSVVSEAGLDSYTWTVNDPKRAIELARLGVSGIITNDPGLMVETLRSTE